MLRQEGDMMTTQGVTYITSRCCDITVCDLATDMATATRPDDDTGRIHITSRSVDVKVRDLATDVATDRWRNNGT